MASPTKQILIAGLGRFTPAYVVVAVQEKVQADLKRARELGYEMTALEINPEERTSSINTVKENLEAKRFDAVIIGFGLRGMKENTVVFEEVVNAAREVAPGMRLLFSEKPDGIVECLERWFGKVEE